MDGETNFLPALDVLFQMPRSYNAFSIMPDAALMILPSLSFALECCLGIRIPAQKFCLNRNGIGDPADQSCSQPYFDTRCFIGPLLVSLNR